jgi:hypothetical protein
MAKRSMNNMAWIKAKIEAHFQCAGVGGIQFPGASASPQAILSRSFAAVGVAGNDGADNADHAKRQTPNAKRQTPNANRQTPNAKRQTPNAKRQDAATRWRLRFVVAADQQLRGRLCG